DGSKDGSRVSRPVDHPDVGRRRCRVRPRARAGAAISSRDLKALAEREHLKLEVATSFAHIDALLAPVTMTPTIPNVGHCDVVAIIEAVNDGPVVGPLRQSCLAQALNEADAVLHPPERRRYPVKIAKPQRGPGSATTRRGLPSTS